LAKEILKLGNLKKVAGATKKRKRIGRGPGSGHGKTSTRGHKGQLARAGAKRRPWFEGGQMPLSRRVPKRGFTSLRKKEFQIVNLKSLSLCNKGQLITPLVLRNLGLIKKEDQPVKILGEGEISFPLTVQAHAFSKAAKQKIEAGGGKVELIQ
jgi:large subunit ribosomal protein L15